VNEVTASISRAPERRVIIALTLLAAVLRLVHIGAQSLWVDEMFTLIVATPKPGYPLDQLLLHNIHGPLHTPCWPSCGPERGRRVNMSARWQARSRFRSCTWVRPRFGATLHLVPGAPRGQSLHIHYSGARNYAFAVFSCGGLCAADR
jgi:hypothetical protein